MTDTINNQIPFVPENTIDPASGLNLSLNTIDALLQVLVQTVGENTPPAGVEGQRFIVGTAPTGAWAGQANKLARFLDGAWQFFDARYVLNAVDGLWYVRSASTWTPLAGGGGGEANTASNLGAGEGLYASKVGVDLRFKSLVQGANVTLTSDGDTVTISAAGGGGGSGTVTSVALDAPVGFDVTGSPVTTSGTLALSFATGYSLPTDTAQGNWNTAFSWGDHAAAGYEKELTAGSNITIDRTDPDNPIISSTAAGGGGGDVVGPASAVNNGVALFDGITGKLLKDGGVLGSAAFTASTAYATAAQGALAGTALQPAAIGVTVQGYSANLAAWSALATSTKQDTLVSATNIKTINGSSVLGSGDLTVGGMTSPMTTAGDIIVGGVGGVPARLAKGVDDTVLTLVAGVPTWVPPPYFKVEYIAIAGGGGGGGNAGGGGGGGGYLTGTRNVLPGESLPIVIGSGGTAGPPNTPGGKGGNTTFLDRSAVGGGGGGAYNNIAPTGGGSGGGGGARTAGAALFGSGTAGQGNEGGLASLHPSDVSQLWGGGGGGAGGAGGNATNSIGGQGGIGLSSSITGVAVTRAAGGAGGGATGAAGVSATANTGDGGGGGVTGGAGGSGVVIISYEGAARATGGSITTNGTKTVHTFTTSGSFMVN